jgi:hypothetical protein
MQARSQHSERGCLSLPGQRATRGGIRSRSLRRKVCRDQSRLDPGRGRGQPARLEAGALDVWETKITVGEWLATAKSNDQRDYLARQDIRAWHEGPRVLLIINGDVARTGGESVIGDIRGAAEV